MAGLADKLPREAQRLYTLTNRAHEIVTGNLTRFGNVLSRAHSDALFALVGGFSALALGLRQRAYPETSERVAYPLDTGLGKTESVVAWVAAIHEEDERTPRLLAAKKPPLSVVVAASKIEALIDLHARLEANGVPAKKIALFHGKKYDPAFAGAARGGDPQVTDRYASMPSASEGELHARPYALVSHERIRRGGDVSYLGRPRSLVIWDEALLTTSASFVNLEDLHVALGALGASSELERDPHLRNAFAWLSTVEVELLGERERQEREPGTPARLLRFPHIDAVDVERFQAALAEEVRRRRGKTRELAATVDALLARPYEPMRLVRSMKDEAVACYEITVPDALKPLAILDASYPIKELERIDATIERERNFPVESDGIKSYARVRGHLWLGAAGREKIEGEHLAAVTREAARLVSEDIPVAEGVLFITHRHRDRTQPHVAERLREELRRRGVELDATVDVEGERRPRFGWLTFGSETSSNDYTHLRHVVLVGLLFRGDADLASAFLGQQRALTGEVTAEDVHRLRISEATSVLYQGLSRGSCRLVENGEARPMDFYLRLSPKDAGAVQELLAQRMPGLAWVGWVTGGLAAEEAARAIETYLDRLPPTVQRVSSERVKRDAPGLALVKETTYRRGRDLVLGRRGDWVQRGRSFLRAGADRSDQPEREQPPGA
jgi:hypothetical protein